MKKIKSVDKPLPKRIRDAIEEARPPGLKKPHRANVCERCGERHNHHDPCKDMTWRTTGTTDYLGAIRVLHSLGIRWAPWLPLDDEL